MTLTAVILTLNEAAHISDCIASLSWADNILVFDSYSSDETVALAQAAGVDVVQHRFENYAQQRNAALAAVADGTQWVFFVDADERGSPELQAEIADVTANRPQVGWYIPRHNYIFGKLTKGAGWWPDHQLRLFKFGRVHYERPVHEIAVVDGEIGYLKTPLIHYNYIDSAQFHATQRKYTAFDAKMLAEQGVVPKFHTAWTMPVRHFYRRYVTLNGYRDGLHGLRLSLLMTYYERQKYKTLTQLG